MHNLRRLSGRMCGGDGDGGGGGGGGGSGVVLSWP